MDRLTPVPVSGLGAPVSALAAGDGHTCALTTGGGVKCWGNNYDGQLGDGQVCGTSCAAPVDVPGLTSGVSAIAAGQRHTCAVISGALKCWGWDTYDQLGAGGLMCETNCTTPVDVFGLSSGVLAVTAGEAHTCALMNTGGVKCWGLNSLGQVGDGTMTNRPTPVDVPALSGVVAITAGIRHTCAVTAGGGAKCWGFAAFGQLGDGTAGSSSCGCRTTPVDVLGLGTGVEQVAGGWAHSCAVMSAGAVKCWGGGGVLGNADTAGSTTPVDVVGFAGGGAVAIAADFSHTCALTDTATVKCWGNNYYGQLGDGTTASRTAPVDVVTVVKPTPTPTPKNPDGDTDGDTIPNSSDPDDDNDGCTDVMELGANPSQGGLRNPHFFWDFYDTPDSANVRDKVVTVTGDIFRVAQRFGANDAGGTALINRNSDPLAGPPPAAPAYHPAFDRGPLVGSDLWDSGPPDGTITVTTDIFQVARQFGHSCL